MRIIWDQTTRGEWRDLLGRVPQSNLLYTWSYAHAVRLHRQMMTRFGVIEVDGRPRGLLEVQEAGLGKLIQAVTVHRGPLWLDTPATSEEWATFLDVFNDTYPRRLGRIRRFMPEMEDSPEVQRALAAASFKRSGEGYETLWLDLRPDTESLRKGLKQKWRNALNGSERNDLTLDLDVTGTSSSWLLSRYGQDKAEREFGGATPKFLQQMVSDSVIDEDSLILRALHEGKPVAGVLLFIHGHSATYQVGWSGDEGRRLKAHHYLLWQGLVALKERGCDWLDLGGINPDEAEGVTRFKEGLGGTRYKTAGLYK